MVTFFRNLINKNPLKVLVAIEFKGFTYSIKKIYTLRGYVTFFIEDWRCVLGIDYKNKQLKINFNEVKENGV